MGWDTAKVNSPAGRRTAGITSTPMLGKSAGVIQSDPSMAAITGTASAIGASRTQTSTLTIAESLVNAVLGYTSRAQEAMGDPPQIAHPQHQLLHLHLHSSWKLEVVPHKFGLSARSAQLSS